MAGDDTCPVCSETLDLDDVSTGDILDCPSCATALDVVADDPPSVVVADGEEVEEGSTGDEAGAEFDDYDDDEDTDDDGDLDDDEGSLD